tara:strand:+ start:23769 stop:25586 length:1818 start_codon:yes stop_codon:yes gene_type:complete
MKILGISAFYHDSAVALIDDGNIISCIQEERISRKKNDHRFPINALKKILELNNLSLSEIDSIVFYEKPFLKFNRILEVCLAFAPRGFSQFAKSIPIWIKEKLFLKMTLIAELEKIEKIDNIKEKIKFSEHHLSHAASAFFPSSYEKSLILTLDGVGEWATSSISIGNKNEIIKISEIKYPHSLGLLYSAFTLYCGFKVNEGEYKLMGLAPYGEPKYKDLIYKNLVSVSDDGSFELNMDYFDYCTGLRMFNEKFCKLFGKKYRKLNDNRIDIFYMDIAASIQEVIEEIILKICRNLKQVYQIDKICLAGGVALNCVANGKIEKEKIFSDIYIQPAAGDAGGALGAALAYWHIGLNKPKLKIKNYDTMQGSYLGPCYTNEEVKEFLDENSISYKYLDNEKLNEDVAKLLSEQKVIGWFQGKMEFGPRALGNRSILGDPRGETMQSLINQKVKFREGFRPFAPSVLKEHSKNWFDLNIDSPYMLLVSKINKSKIVSYDDKNVIGLDKLNIKRSIVPAITHVNLTARVQTIERRQNEMYYNLISKFYELTECPILINTSFNIRDEPIVCSPVDAFKCFLISDLDYLVMGNYILNKQDQYPENNYDFLS